MAHLSSTPGLSVTVLGSGSPFTNSRRVSAGYLIWTGQRPRLLVDVGGGVFERLGQLGVSPADLDAVVLTHTHIDHTGGLPAVVFAAVMADRDRPLLIAGPSRKNDQPGCSQFCELLFGETGAWNYLHSFENFAITAREIDHRADAAQPVTWPGQALDGLALSAIGVAHGMMPSLAYRIEHAGQSIVISGDLERASDTLVKLARGCDVLVHDQALPRRDAPHGHLHAPPEETGANAAAAGTRKLVLSHLMPPAEEEHAEVLAKVAFRYGGQIKIASDLMTVTAA